MNLIPALPLKSSAIIMDGASWVGDVKGDVTGNVTGNVTGDIIYRGTHGPTLLQNGSVKLFDSVTVSSTPRGGISQYSPLSPLLTPIKVFDAIVPSKITINWNASIPPYTWGGIQSLASDGTTVLESTSANPATFSVANLAYLQTYAGTQSQNGNVAVATLPNLYLDW